MSTQNTTPDTSAVLSELGGSETGARNAQGRTLLFMLAVPFLWSVLQIWYASPLPQMMGFSWLNEDIAKFIHLSLALALAFLYFPATKGSPRNRVPLQDWILAAVSTLCIWYLIIFREDIVNRLGAPSGLDVLVGVGGVLLLLEGTRRALGPPLAIVAVVFLGYSLAGPWMPDVIAHKGASLNKLVSHQWFTTEGVFGVAIGVSTTFVFLFVLFGALLDKAGAGSYFINVAFSLLGHLRGGPAKAAVVASGLSGVVSGSSIANVVTTGTFTIPLMKRVGFSGVKSGAVEVAASTNGQLTPPIMGAAAFLMVEYVGISYVEVIKHAILPALISYVALFYIVHLEAVKAGMQGLPRSYVPKPLKAALSFLTVFIGLGLLTLVIYYGIGWTKQYLGSASIFVVSTAVLLGYIGLVRYAANFAEAELQSPSSGALVLPKPGPTLKSGLYFLLPVAVLIWCLTVERFSPGLSAFWATLFMIIIVLTHRPLLAVFQRSENINTRDVQLSTLQGFHDFVDAFVSGARNMIGIGVATAAAGIVVGTITLTGVGQVMTEVVEILSGGSLLAMLLLTAVICLILGMGLPTTANYIVVSSLMAPVIVTLGAENGLVVPLIAVHLFVFYFGILADDTPPVGLAAFAAAAIAKSDPIRTGVQGFTYDIRTAILPFMFIFNTQLLLFDIDSIFELMMTIFSATLAMLIFSAATQGYWFVKSRWYETLALLLCTFALFRPGFFWDAIYPPTYEAPGIQFEEQLAKLEEGDTLKLYASGTTIDGDDVRKLVSIPIQASTTAAPNRAIALGLDYQINERDEVILGLPMFGSAAETAGLDWGWQIESVQIPLDRPEKQWVFVPVLVLLAGIAKLQMRRRDRTEKPNVTMAAQPE